MKKFFSVMLLALAIIFVGNNSASAKDVYIESSSGRDIYVVAESIDKSEPDTVKVTLKYVKNSYLDEVEHLIYFKPPGDMWWVNSEEAKRDGLRATRVWEPEKDKVLQYCLHY